MERCTAATSQTGGSRQKAEGRQAEGRQAGQAGIICVCGVWSQRSAVTIQYTATAKGDLMWEGSGGSAGAVWWLGVG